MAGSARSTRLVARLEKGPEIYTGVSAELLPLGCVHNRSASVSFVPLS